MELREEKNNLSKKKKTFLLRLEKSVVLQVCFFALTMLLLFGIYLPLSVWMQKERATEKILRTVVTENSNVLLDITEVQNSDKTLTLSGWVIGLNTEKQEVRVVLSPLDVETEQDIVVETKQEENTELLSYLAYYKQEQSAGSGFLAEVKQEKLAKDVCYEVLFYVEAEQNAKYIAKVSSGKYLYNEEVYPYNPLEFAAPQFTDEQMAMVVAEGNLLGYTMEHGAWVYQYEDDLYWILDKNVGRNAEEDLYMFFHLNTSTPELLPEERKQYGFDNQDFRFKLYELEISEDSTYRVAVRSIKNEYPVTYISTGHYSEWKNVWVIKGRMEKEN